MNRRHSAAPRPSGRGDAARPRRRSWIRSLFSRRNKEIIHDSTLDAVAAPAQVAVSVATQLSSTEEEDNAASPWSHDVLTTCFAYLDTVALVHCAGVAKEWHAAAQGPTLWTAQYCVTWRHGAPLPEVLARTFSHGEMTRICKERRRIPLALNTRASWWLHDDGTAHVLNTSLRYRRRYILSAHNQHALRPLGLCRAPRSATLMETQDNDDQDDVGVCYFEVTIRGRGSVGITRLDASPALGETSDEEDERATSQVGHWAGSYGYHGAGGDFFWHDRDDPRVVTYGPPWGYERGFHTPTREQLSTTLGCGLDVRSGRLFFTKDGEWLGDAYVRVATPTSGYCAAVSLENRADTAEINVGRAPFVFDVEAHVAARNAVATTTAAA